MMYRSRDVLQIFTCIYRRINRIMAIKGVMAEVVVFFFWRRIILYIPVFLVLHMNSMAL